MKVLVTGAKGQLGYDVVNECKSRMIEVVGVDIDEMDITNEEQVYSVINDVKPDAVIHCAAYTAVDLAESNQELCRKINVDGTRYIANACKMHDIKMIYISTDYVFDGQGEIAFLEGDKKDPLNFYGLTKYEGELEVKALLEKYFIVRISWVFGLNGKNFIKTMLRLGDEKGVVSVVNDQIGSPTYTVDLATLLVDMVQTEKYGEYHATNEGYCSWYEFACEIFRQTDKPVVVLPVDSSGFRSAAKRPANSRMSQKNIVKNGFAKLPTWQDALNRYLKELGAIE